MDKSRECFLTWRSNGKVVGSKEHVENKIAKKALRAAQRQKRAKERERHLNDIKNAHSGDKQLFFKLIHKQRSNQKDTVEVDFGEDSELDGWANYFENLATPQDLPQFDNEHFGAREIRNLLLHETLPMVTAPEVTEEQMRKDISSLKNGKAIDYMGLTAEHVKYASPKIVKLLTQLVNSIMLASRLPDQLRPGLITPILKKGKDGRDPDSYRRITVSPILGKFLEKEMLRRTRQSIKHEPLQFGFTEGCSSTTCAFIITEAVAEAMDLGHPLYISFLDAKKAFDHVSHTNMLGSLLNEGLEAPLWRMYADIYSHITSKVKLRGNLSREIKEGQGIWQGADTSPEIFNGRGNSLIRKLKTLTDSARIGSIPVGAPTTADDIAMLSKTRLGAQTQLLIAEDDANKKRYLFSTTKSRIMAVNSTASDKESLHLTLNGEEIKMSEKEKHVGLQRTEKWGNKETVEERIKNGRRTAYALFGSGYHGLNGLPPSISTRMVSLFVTPVMLHSLEALILKKWGVGAARDSVSQKCFDVYSTCRRVQHCRQYICCLVVFQFKPNMNWENWDFSIDASCEKIWWNRRLWKDNCQWRILTPTAGQLIFDSCFINMSCLVHFHWQWPRQERSYGRGWSRIKSQNIGNLNLENRWETERHLNIWTLRYVLLEWFILFGGSAELVQIFTWHLWKWGWWWNAILCLEKPTQAHVEKRDVLCVERRQKLLNTFCWNALSWPIVDGHIYG